MIQILIKIYQSEFFLIGIHDQLHTLFNVCFKLIPIGLYDAQIHNDMFALL